METNKALEALNRIEDDLRHFYGSTTSIPDIETIRSVLRGEVMNDKTQAVLNKLKQADPRTSLGRLASMALAAPSLNFDDLDTLYAALANKDGDAKPIAWRCRDYADGWIYFDDENRARRYRETTGALMEPLYAR